MLDGTPVNYIVVPSKIYTDDRLKFKTGRRRDGQPGFLYTDLLAYCFFNGPCHYTNDEIAQQIGLTPKDVKKFLAKLVEAEYIAIGEDEGKRSITIVDQSHLDAWQKEVDS